MKKHAAPFTSHIPNRFGMCIQRTASTALRAPTAKQRPIQQAAPIFRKRQPDAAK
jgi:hypothetical protein